MNQRTSPHWNQWNLSEWETVPISKDISGRSSGCSNWRRNPLPVVAFRTEKEISDNYTKILKDIKRMLGMEDQK